MVGDGEGEPLMDADARVWGGDHRRLRRHRNFERRERGREARVPMQIANLPYITRAAGLK